MTTHHTPLHETSRPAAPSRLGGALSPIRAEFGIVACSRCLRVQRGSNWFEAEETIRALRSFELADAPKLLPGLCDRCRSAIDAMRAPAPRRAAA
jgi:hypothetical protein